MLGQMVLLGMVLLSVGAVNALIPIIIILILIAAAAAMRGTNLLQMFGISALAGIGIAGRGSLSQRNAFNAPARSLVRGKIGKNTKLLNEKINKKIDPYSGDKRMGQLQADLASGKITREEYKQRYEMIKKDIDNRMKLEKENKARYKSGAASAMDEALQKETGRSKVRVGQAEIIPLYSGTAFGRHYRNAKRYAVSKNGKPVKVSPEVERASKQLQKVVNNEKLSASERATAQEQLDLIADLRHNLSSLEREEGAKMREFNERKKRVMSDLRIKYNSGAITKKEYKEGKRRLKTEEEAIKKNFAEAHANVLNSWYLNQWAPKSELKAITSRRAALDEKFENNQLKIDMKTRLENRHNTYGELKKAQYRKELSDIENHLNKIAPNGEYDSGWMKSDIRYRLEKGIYPKKEWSPEGPSTRGVKEFEERKRINKKINKSLK